MGSTRVKVHLDTFHMNLEEQDWRRAILSCKGRLGHVHVADNSRNYPGWGLIDFRQIMSLLLEIGYNRSLTLECFPVPDGETALRRELKAP
ncbi:MAG: TIM barrel protein [Enterocloster bolteae]